MGYLIKARWPCSKCSFEKKLKTLILPSHISIADQIYSPELLSVFLGDWKRLKVTEENSYQPDKIRSTGKDKIILDSKY